MNLIEMKNYIMFGRHPSLLRLSGYALNDSHICLIYEFIPIENITTFLSRNKLQNYEKIKAIYGIYSVIVFMYSKNFMPKDIKLDNFLINDKIEIIF